MRNDLFEKIVNLPIKYLDSHPHGDIMSRMTNDIENVSNTISMSLSSLVSGALTLIGTAGMMFYLCPMLALLSCTTVILTVVATKFLSGAMRKFYRKRQVLLGNLNSTVEEMVGGYKTVVAYSREEAVIDSFNTTSDELTKVGIVAEILGGSMGPVMNAINNVSFVIIAAFGGYFAIKGTITIGIISVIMAYTIALPLGVLMALKKDKFIDKLGTFYIVFIMAVPSLGYIFIFRAIGSKLGFPTTFNIEDPTTMMYVLPIISLALPSIANLMKWLRRYMIDQMNSDYVKFARSGGLSESEIFSKHILKNAAIPIVHGIPASVLGAMTGAIITERVYLVPGIGNVLTTAINAYDNGVIVGVTLFYAVISVTAVILGDVLMAMMDPRISFTTKAR